MKNLSCIFQLLQSFYSIRIAALVLVVLFIRNLDSAPITNPHRPNSDITKVIPDYFDSKTASKSYHNSFPHIRPDVPIIAYNSRDPDCNVGFKLAWSSTVGSPVYAPPVIFPSGT